MITESASIAVCRLPFFSANRPVKGHEAWAVGHGYWAMGTEYWATGIGWRAVKFRAFAFRAGPDPFDSQPYHCYQAGFA